MQIQIPEITAGRGIRLRWEPDIFGTWQYQIIAFRIDNLATNEGVFVPTNGPSGADQFWHILDFGQTTFEPGTGNFFEGWADFTISSDSDWVFFIRGLPWLSPFAPGEFAVSPLFSTAAP